MSNVQVYQRTETGCDSIFLSKSAMYKRIKRKHRSERVHCRYRCGRSYVNQCDSLSHERTYDRNLDAARIGGGINQQHYHSRSQADQRMRQVNSLHGDFRMYRKSLNFDVNIYEKLRHAILHDVREVLRTHQSNIKYYVTGKFVFEKAHRPGI